MGLEYSVRPLSKSIPVTGIDPNFKASWSDTLRLLEREVCHIGAQRVLFELSVRESDLRLDGQLRSTARPEHQGLAIVLLGTEKGDLRLQARLVGADGGYRRGIDAPWQHNARAIALTLEALRRIERYGTTPSSEHYTGFRALPAGGQTQEDLVALGADLVRRAGGYRKALALHHPDNDGAHEDFIAVQAWKAAQGG